MANDISIHVNDVGTIFKFEIKDPITNNLIDISTALEVKKIYFEKPDHTRFSRSAVFYTDGTDGILQYISIEGDIDMPGKWSIQCFIDMFDGCFYTSKTVITVLPNIAPFD